MYGPCHSFSIFSWILNSLTAHIYPKVSFLRAYVTIKKFDVVCLSEIYLDSSNHLMMTFLIFLVLRADHPSNTKKRCVDLYFKISLPLKINHIQLLQKCINFEKKLLTKQIILSLCIDLTVNPKMNLNRL